MKLEHTPGPWMVTRAEKSPCSIEAGSAPGISLAKVYLTDYETRKRSPEHEANARLIAAAPRLLKALIDADDLISQLMPGVKHIALQNYAFLNETLMENTAAIKAATETQP